MKSGLAISDLKGKRVLVMGLGLHGGGVETVKFLLKEGASVTVTDLRKRRDLAPSLKKLNKYKCIGWVLGKHRKSDFLKNDLIVKNPGVVPDSPYLIFARKHGIPVTTDVGIFFRRFPGKIVGITGTRGKSTAAYLIWRFMGGKFRRRVHLGGNIRKSVLPILATAKKGDYAVLELSSFQLEDLSKERTKRKSPEIAVITNLLPDHLNWHKTFKNYLRAKSYLFAFQKKGNYIFANPADKTVRKLVGNTHSRVIFPILPKKLRELVSSKIGKHYEPVAALALAVARYLGVPQGSAVKELERFGGLPGREEKIAVRRGVRFINDTTATIPEATLAALNRFSDKKENLILIAGGSDKKLNFRTLVKKIKEKVKRLILLPGSASEKIKKGLKTVNYETQKIHRVRSMKEAVKTANRLAQKGDWVILSPGAASFGLFLNEFDRGDQFVKEVLRLNPHTFPRGIKPRGKDDATVTPRKVWG